ncbi:MAG TPA: SAP domain-containing protein [Candidatus Limnocylindrales bacterium]
MSHEPMTIKLNDGQIVTRPYREAVSLLSRRLADVVDSGETEDFVPLQKEVTETTRTLDDLNKDELIERAKEMDLPVYGTKAELIERINDRLSATTVEDDLDDLVGASPEDVPGEDSDDSDDGRN